VTIMKFTMSDETGAHWGHKSIGESCRTVPMGLNVSTPTGS